jgi:hypothetical protein
MITPRIRRSLHQIVGKQRGPAAAMPVHEIAALPRRIEPLGLGFGLGHSTL